MSIQTEKVTLELTEDGTTATFDANRSPKVNCWRLIYNNNQIVDLFESDGITTTKHDLFCGTQQECNDLIASLKLTESESYAKRKAALENTVDKPDKPKPTKK
jgi:hypothetical protein